MAAKIKILIVGGNGFVGSSLARILVKNHYIFCTYRRSYTPIKGVSYIPLPTLSEKDHCDRLVTMIKPDLVIYCLGSNVEPTGEKENKLAQNIHANGITNIMYSSEMAKAKFIYISADFVFSGIDGNFSEHDTTIAYSQLGKIKAGAENALKTRSLNYLVIRSAPLLGRGTIDHPSSLDKIRESIFHGKKVMTSSRMIQNPVHVSFLATVLEKVIENDIKNKILHVGGLTRISTYDLAKKFMYKMNLPTDFIECNDIGAISSPIDYSLNFTETLSLIEAEPLLLEQSFDLL